MVVLKDSLMRTKRRSRAWPPTTAFPVEPPEKAGFVGKSCQIGDSGLAARAIGASAQTILAPAQTILAPAQMRLASAQTRWASARTRRAPAPVIRTPAQTT